MKQKVLVVEDDKDIQEIIEYNFTSEGYEVITCSDGEDAVNLIRHETPDLVLSLIHI